MTARPWPEGTRPTANDLLEHLRTLNDLDRSDEALVILDRLLTAADRADRCLLMDHDTAVAQAHRDRARVIELTVEAERLVGRLLRYRLAWTSARRRTRNPFHAIRTLDRAKAAATIPREEAPEERCPHDGQTPAWHRATNRDGRSNGEFIGCDYAREEAPDGD